MIDCWNHVVKAAETWLCIHGAISDDVNVYHTEGTPLLTHQTRLYKTTQQDV